MNYLAVLTQDSFGSESGLTQADRDAAAYFRANHRGEFLPGLRGMLSLLFPPKQDRQFMRAMTRPQPKQRSSAPVPVAAAPPRANRTGGRIVAAVAPVACGALLGHFMFPEQGAMQGAAAGIGSLVGGIGGGLAGGEVAKRFDSHSWGLHEVAMGSAVGAVGGGAALSASGGDWKLGAATGVAAIASVLALSVVEG